MSNPLVSVVITTYKRPPEMIERSILSVLKQTYKNIELLIIDDSPNSYDKRKDVKIFCESINDDRVRYIQHDVNSGACVARNTGMNNSLGEYIAFLDDDDEWLPEKVEEMLPLLLNNSKVAMIYCNAEIVEDEGSRDWFSAHTPQRGNVYEELSCDNFVGSTSFPIIRIEALREINGFDPAMEASQDWDTWIRISKTHEIDYVEKKLVKYYIHTGVRITNDTRRRIRALTKLNEKQQEYLSNHKRVLRKRKEFELRLHIQCADISKAIVCYLNCIKAMPSSILDNIILLKAFARLIVKK